MSQAIDLVVESQIPLTPRVEQLGAMFDCPVHEKLRCEWHGAIDLDAQPWQVGLIVGPSGAGKTKLLEKIFGAPESCQWSAPSVVDDFAKERGIQEIAGVCQAVGFNTIPAWMRPYAVLSNGEKFRVELARRLLETEGTIVIDEFTSVVDRQVAQIGAHAAQKYVRKNGKKLVAASCHYDIVDWLQPD